MTHLSADLLRRHRDDPSLLASTEKEHLLACQSCRALRDEIAANAAFAERTLALPDATLDIDGARAAVAARSGDELYAAATSKRRWSPRSRWIGAAAAAVVLGVGLSLSPVRTTAANFLAIFEPHSFQPIAMTSADITSLRDFPNLDAFGNVVQTGPATGPSGEFTDVLAAMRAAHQQIVHPAYIPPGIQGSATYHVIPAHTGAFTFSAAKARAAALHDHAVLPPMPSNLDGSTLYATFAPAVITTYGTTVNHAVGSGQATRPSTIRGRIHRLGAHGSAYSTWAGFVLMQSPVPRVYSTGASVQDIVGYLLQQPGVSPRLAAQIRAIGDPSTTLPIPIPVDHALAQTVSIGGSPALVVGDETGVGSAIVFQRNGMVYGIMGPLRESVLLAVANSLTQ
jgi:hypothetical protein